MPTYEERNTIRAMVLNSSTFLDLQGAALLPIACNKVIIVNLSAQTVKFRSDPANASSEIPIANGQSYQIGESPRTGSAQYRYPFNCSAVGSLITTSGAATVQIHSEI